MANTIEIIIQAIDKASDILLGVEKKATASNVAIAKSFEGVGIASDAIDKKLGEYGAALDKTSVAQNRLRQAQFEAQEAAQKLAQAQYNLTQNTDPAKIDDLNKTLAKSQVELDGAAKKVQEFSKDLRENKAETEGLSGAFSKVQASIIVVNQAMQLVGQVTQGVEQVYNSTVGAVIDYGSKVKDLSLILNLSTEETSKLISIGQKFGVSTEQITSALQMMTKRGMAPSLDGLAKLSDRIMAIDNPVQRAAALSEIFGRQWTSLMPILEKGGEAIRAAGAEAEKFGLVLNQSTTDAIENIQIQINTLNERVDALKIKAGTGLLPVVSNVVEAFDKFATVVGGTETPLERMNRVTEYLISVYGRESDEVKRAKQEIEDYKGMVEAVSITTDEKAIRSNMAFIQSFVGLKTGLWDLGQGVRNQADVYAVLDSAMDKTATKTALLAANQRTLAAEAKTVAGQMADLHTKMGGAAQNEMKSYEERQASLADQAKNVSEEIAKLQRESSKTSTEHKMSASELALAQAQLTAMEAKYAAGAEPVAQAHKKTKETAEEAAAAEEKMARAAQNNASQHAVLGAQIAVAREKIANANSSVTTYTDNSEKIGDLKDQYAKINDEIQKNADQHDIATKRIVFGYLEQELAAQGMTGESAKALDALAEKWGLLSKADIAALNDARIAAKTFAQDKSFEHLAASADAAIADAKKPAKTAAEAAKEASRATGGLSDLVKDQSDKINSSLNSTKQPSQSFVEGAKAMQNEFDTSRTKAMELVNYGFTPMSTVLSTLTQQVSIFSIALGKLPGVAALLPTYVPPRLPTNPEGRTNPLPGGAQKGADFVVPPGFPGDTFPLRVTSGERVQVTPVGQSRAPVSAGQSSAQMPTINITQNFSGAQSSPEQYRAIVYDVMNDVIKTAMRQ